MIKKRLILSGVAVVFIASFILFFVFDKLNALEEACAADRDTSMLCEQFGGAGLAKTVIFFFVLLVILAIVATVYVMLTSTS